MSARPAIVVLTGSGISRESGLHTFRDPDGIWSQVKLEDVATPEAFARDPARVHEFYNARRRHLLSDSVAPNPAHLALAELESNYQGEVLIVTQNIDNLHERAGSRNLIHMHGEGLKARCGRCGGSVEWHEDLSIRDACPGCGEAGAMRPDVVWFGETPRDLDRIFDALARCGLFLAIGTSGAVYPAAGFVEQVRARGGHTVELNIEPSLVHNCFAESISGPASMVVPEYVAKILQVGW